jgi:catechol 2,3-dioxygenase-like lactoylglutathione lyase family enzyme
MTVQVYDCSHVVIEVDDVEKAVEFYKDVYNLERMAKAMLSSSWENTSCYMAIFKVEKLQHTRRLAHPQS